MVKHCLAVELCCFPVSKLLTLLSASNAGVGGADVIPSNTYTGAAPVAATLR